MWACGAGRVLTESSGVDENPAPFDRRYEDTDPECINSTSPGTNSEEHRTERPRNRFGLEDLTRRDSCRQRASSWIGVSGGAEVIRDVIL